MPCEVIGKKSSNSGFDGYLSKPINPCSLTEELNRLLDKRDEKAGGSQQIVEIAVPESSASTDRKPATGCPRAGFLGIKQVFCVPESIAPRNGMGG